jgi:ABC-2 type transport system ATP-binding protein
MKKKLALACTLIHTPELILLDEPTTGVDPISRNEFWTILGAIQEQGVAIVMTTPYLDEAERCHRIGLMHAGRLLMTGTPEAVKAALPGAMFQLECPNPPAAHRLLRTRWSFTRLVLRGDVLLFWAPQGEAEAAEAAEWLNRQGLGPATSSVTAPSLEDAFVALLGNRETHGGKQ